MPLPATQRIVTASEYFEMPEGPPYFQLVRGELFMSPSPVIRHQKVLGKLYYLIAQFLETNQLGEVILAPSDVKLGEMDVYQPDLYYVSRERSAIFVRQGTDGAPDLIVEILSPSTARLDRHQKLPVYREAGVREIWFVDLGYDRIEIHRFPADSGAASVISLERNDVLTTPLLPGLEIPVAKALV